MVTPASDRIAKYTVKYDTTVIKSRLDAAKDIAIAKITTVYDALAAMEIAVGEKLDSIGFFGLDRPKHYNFAREMWAMCRVSAGGVARVNAATILLNKYVSLGLGAALLRAIALDIFSVVIP